MCIRDRLKNVRYAAGKEPLNSDLVKAVIAAKSDVLIGKGRLLIRKSGTEPLIRVMAECEDEVLLHQVVDDIVGAVQSAV